MLIKCRSCRRETNDQLRTCPHCGTVVDTTEHSPTPWERNGKDIIGAIEEGPHDIPPIDYANVQLVLEYSPYRGRICTMIEGGKTSEANAEFIVRACNAHADLLEACKTAADILDKHSIGGSHVPLLRDAIAKAETGIVVQKPQHPF